MRESSIVVRPEPTGSTSYLPSRRLQAAGLLQAANLFEQLAAKVPLPTAPRPIVIADYGASTGYNSLLPVSAAITVLRTVSAAITVLRRAHSLRPRHPGHAH